jgi:hypothetical protein
MSQNSHKILSLILIQYKGMDMDQTPKKMSQTWIMSLSLAT